MASDAVNATSIDMSFANDVSLIVADYAYGSRLCPRGRLNQLKYMVEHACAGIVLHFNCEMYMKLGHALLL